MSMIPEDCDRCHKPMRESIMSYFNNDTLCPACLAEEVAHPDYELAKDVEHAFVSRGERNFLGVGWPGPDGRVDPLWNLGLGPATTNNKKE
jgi:hypothetical protein